MLNEFNYHIGDPSSFTIGVQRTFVATRFYFGVKGWVWIGTFTLTNFNGFDWTDDHEFEEYYLKTGKEFRDLTKEEIRKLRWGWLEDVE
jgi:hypothetical protein